MLSFLGGLVSGFLAKIAEFFGALWLAKRAGRKAQETDDLAKQAEDFKDDQDARDRAALDPDYARRLRDKYTARDE